MVLIEDKPFFFFILISNYLDFFIDFIFFDSFHVKNQEKNNFFIEINTLIRKEGIILVAD
jgi:hypothetical protein